MTPERLAEIRDRVTYNPEDWPITIELVAHIDTITAENERLKGEVERLRKALAESAGAEVKAYDKLDALVKAGEKVVGILGDIKTLLTQSQPSSPREGRVYDGITAALALLQAEKEGKV